jgi:hypothetical protein
LTEPYDSALKLIDYIESLPSCQERDEMARGLEIFLLSCKEKEEREKLEKEVRNANKLPKL